MIATTSRCSIGRAPRERSIDSDRHSTHDRAASVIVTVKGIWRQPAMGAPRSATPRRTSSSAPPSAMAPAATGTGMPANGSQARPPPMKPDSRASPPASSTAATNALEASRSRGDPLRRGMNSPTPHTIRTCAEALSIQPWRVTRSHSSSPGAVPTIAGTWISVPTMVSSRTIRPAKRAPA